MNSLLEAALDYASSRGWPVFPVRTDKTPYTRNGVLDATTSEEQIKKWWNTWPSANIGLDVGGAGMMVLDLDPGHEIEDLDRSIDGLPETKLRARTPRGGEHLFFALDDGEIVSPSASKLAPHVDVRSFNSYVLLAPSQTKDGAYTWEGEGKAAFRTDEMVRKANAYRGKHEDRDNWLIEADLPENIELAVGWLKKDARIAIEGRGGDLTAYATAAYMKSFGLSEEMALELIWEHWNPRCEPPWSAEEHDHLANKVRNAYQYNTSPPGNVTPAYRVAVRAQLFEPKRIETVDGGNILPAGRFIFMDRLGMDTIQPPDWLLKDWLPEESYAILFGGFGTFKTFVALDMALSIANGITFGEDTKTWDVVSSGPVLFAAGEGKGGITKRVAAWEKAKLGGAKTNKNFVLVSPVPRIYEDDTEFAQFIAGAKLMHGQYKLVIIDTLGRAMQGENENAQEHASAFTAMVEDLQRELGCTVLALHHVGHGDKSRERGSVVFGADADTRFMIEREKQSQIIKLSVAKQKDAVEAPPRMLRLAEVKIGDTTSLAALAVPEEQSKAADPKEQARRTEVDKKAKADLYDECVYQWLRSTDKNSQWTNAQVCDGVTSMFAEELDGLTSKAFQNNGIRQVKAMPKGKSRQYYDARRKNGPWKYTGARD